MGQTHFCLFPFFSQDKYSTHLTINDKSIGRWGAWDSNLGHQDGRRRRIHWAMAAPLGRIVTLMSRSFLLRSTRVCRRRRRRRRRFIHQDCWSHWSAPASAKSSLSAFVRNELIQRDQKKLKFKVKCCETCFLQKWPSRPLFSLFSSLQINMTFLQKKFLRKRSIQYSVLGFEPMTFRHESALITTRPGFPPLCKTFLLKCHVLTWANSLLITGGRITGDQPYSDTVGLQFN